MTDTEFHLSDSADHEVAQYRPLSSLAVASVAAAVLSPLALAAVGFWLVPVVGILLAVAALMSSSLRQGISAGRNWAVVGLVGSSLFLSIAASQYFYYRHLVYREARYFADGWLRLVKQGKTKIAHQATLPNFRRQVSAFGLDQAYANNEELTKRLDDFYGQTGPSYLKQLAENIEFQFVRNVEQTLNDRTRYVVLEYRVSDARSPQQPAQRVELLLQRQDAWQDEPISWQLLGVALGEGSSGEVASAAR